MLLLWLTYPHPCLGCGACCAHFRVSFYWAEVDEAAGRVPLEMTRQISPFLRAMKGTTQNPCRCVAPEGEMGQKVRCAIYDQRSSSCRDFRVAWEDGQASEACDKARVAHGLEPLPVPLDRVDERFVGTNG